MKQTKSKKVTVNMTMSKELFDVFAEVTEKKGMNRSSYISMAVSNQIQADKTMEDLPRTIEALKQMAEKERRKEKIKEISE